MSLFSSYADTLFQLGLEQPTSVEFVERPDLRIIASFFLGWTFITCLRYLALAALRHPFADQLIRSILRRPIIVTIAERQLRAKTDSEGNFIQSWLHDTHSHSTTKSDRPEGTRHLSVVLTGVFAVGILMNFLSLLNFEGSNREVLCIVVIAWAGISVHCAKLAGLLRITFDLQRLGINRLERMAVWSLLVLSLGVILAHATISIGASRDVPQIPGLSLCYRRHFLLTSLMISGMNITLEIYCMGRTFFLLVPQFLTFQHKIQILMDVRVARVASMLCLDLLTFLPAAMSLGITAEFVPFSLGVLLVLAAFNHHPAKAAETRSLPAFSSHRTSVLTFPTNNRRGDGSEIYALEIPRKTEAPLPTPPPPVLTPASTQTRAVPRRKSSVASHITYDSEAEARSVHGAVVSFAFKSQEVEPMPAIPYGIYQPKLVGSPKLVTRASSLVQPKSPLSGDGKRAHTVSMVSPLPRPSSLRKPLIQGAKLEAVPVPQLKLTIPERSNEHGVLSPANTDSGSSIVYGSDIIRRSTLQKPAPVQRESISTIKTASHSAHELYTGPDLSHISMGSHSTAFEAKDYLETPPRETGFYRTSTLGAPSLGSGLEAGSRPSTGQGNFRALSPIRFDSWAKDEYLKKYGQ